MRDPIREFLLVTPDRNRRVSRGSCSEGVEMIAHGNQRRLSNPANVDNDGTYFWHSVGFRIAHTR